MGTVQLVWRPWWPNLVLLCKPLGFLCLDCLLFAFWSRLACLGYRLKCLCPNQWSGFWALFFQSIFWQWLLCHLPSWVCSDFLSLYTPKLGFPVFPCWLILSFIDLFTSICLFYTVDLIQEYSILVHFRCMVEFELFKKWKEKHFQDFA